jgi:PAS domain S-box-containing protein
MTPPEPKSIGEAIRGAVRDDPVMRAALGFFLVSACLYPFLASFLTPDELRRSWTFLRLTFLTLVVVALQKGLRRIERSSERRFWNLFTVAFGCWLAVYLGRVLEPDPFSSLFHSLAEEVLYAVYYLALVLAVESRPDRRDPLPGGDLERAVGWPTVTVFVVGLLTYFVLVPALGNRQAYESSLPSLCLYVSLDLYLATLLLYRARSAPLSRWRILYGLLALTTALILITDFLELIFLLLDIPSWGHGTDPVWNLPFLALVLTARLRHAPFPEVPSPESPREPLVSPVEGTMAAALLFPLLHFTCHRLGLLDPLGRSVRESLVLLWLLLLGAIALVQHRLLERKARRLWSDRARFESSLRDSEQDLRLMVERSHAEKELSLSEQKFTKAFRASPDGLAITTLPEGRLLEVNRSFEKTFGYRRDEAVGRTAEELGLWDVPEDRQRMLQILEAEGRVRELETRYRRKSGEVGIGLFSAEPITIDGRSCILSASSDITELHRIEERVRVQASILDRSEDAVAVLDLDDRITYWNRSAEELYGRPAEETRGRSALEIWRRGDLRATREACRRVVEEGFWRGELRRRSRDGRRRVVDSWWTLVRDVDGEPRAKLVIEAPLAEGAESESGD